MRIPKFELPTVPCPADERLARTILEKFQQKAPQLDRTGTWPENNEKGLGANSAPGTEEITVPLRHIQRVIRRGLAAAWPHADEPGCGCSIAAQAAPKHL